MTDWTAYKQGQREQKQKNAAHATATFIEARTLALDNGMKLVAKTEIHYQLSFWKEHRKIWLLNVYPSNQRLYPDSHCKAPFLHVPKPWTFLDVVQAAIRANTEG